MTHEFKEIITAYQKIKEVGLQAVLATVVHVDGSSYRKPGVRMLISGTGEMIGAVSGGCVEKEVCRQAQTVFETGNSKIMTYDGSYRLGCEGVLYILIEPFSPDDGAVLAIVSALRARKSFEIRSYYVKEEQVVSKMGSVLWFEDGEKQTFRIHIDWLLLEHDNTLTCFKEELKPCFRLLIIGAEHDAVQLCKQAAATGWEVTLVGSPKDPKSKIDFPEADEVVNSLPEDLYLENIDKQTAIMLMTHNFAKDSLYLQAIQATEPAYIGLLGPSRRREKLLDAFIDYFPEVSEAFIAVIRGPAGLNIGAETPQEIAISIIAEILAVIRNQNSIPLQEKVGGIHANEEKEKTDVCATKT